jgi:hypothetical protein
MRHYLTVAAALAVATPRLWGQSDDGCHHRDHWDDERLAWYCEVRVERVAAPSGPLDVDARENGGVALLGGTGSDLVIHERVEVEARTDDDARQLASQVHVVTSGGRIHAEGPAEEHHAHWTVSYRIEVPSKLDVTAESTNGPLSASDIAGKIDFRTENGPISLDNVGGTVTARTENGPLDVELTGARWNGSGLDAETENGPVELAFPEHYAAHLEAGTENGPVSIGFPITVEGRINVKRLSMDIGGGGPTVRVVTTNGPVTIEHQ